MPPKWLTVLVSLVALCTLSGCRPHRAGKDHYVTLERRTTYGVRWQLDAWTDDDGHFCMFVDSRKGPYDALWPWGTGACDYSLKEPEGGYWDGVIAPGDKRAKSGTVMFGPLPSNATHIRVTTHTVIGTHPFPKGKGLPPGRFWLLVVGADWPTRAEGKELDNPQPLDSHGHRVPFKAF